MTTYDGMTVDRALYFRGRAAVVARELRTYEDEHPHPSEGVPCLHAAVEALDQAVLAPAGLLVPRVLEEQIVPAQCLGCDRTGFVRLGDEPHGCPHCDGQVRELPGVSAEALWRRAAGGR